MDFSNYEKLLLAYDKQLNLLSGVKLTSEMADKFKSILIEHHAKVFEELQRAESEVCLDVDETIVRLRGITEELDLRKLDSLKLDDHDLKIVKDMIPGFKSGMEKGCSILDLGTGFIKSWGVYTDSSDDDTVMLNLYKAFSSMLPSSFRPVAIECSGVYNLSDIASELVMSGVLKSDETVTAIANTLCSISGSEDLQDELDGYIETCSRYLVIYGSRPNIELDLLSMLYHASDKSIEVVPEFKQACEDFMSDYDKYKTYLGVDFTILSSYNITKKMGKIGYEVVAVSENDAVVNYDKAGESLNIVAQNQNKGQNMSNKIENINMPLENLAEIVGCEVSELVDIYNEAGGGEKGEVAVAEFVKEQTELNKPKMIIAPERSLWEKYRDLPLWQQILIGAGVIGAVAGVGYLIYNACSSNNDGEWEEVKLLNQ